jgi:hypothetical protein
VYADLDHALSDKGTPDAQSGEPQPHPARPRGPPSAAPARKIRDVAVQGRPRQRHAGGRVRPQWRQLLRAPLVDAEVGRPRRGRRARRRAAGLAGRGR